MPDLSHLSDNDLQAIAGGGNQPPDLSHLSDSDLHKIISGPESQSSAGGAFVDSAANTATFGYMPQIVGGITKLINPTEESIRKSISVRDTSGIPNKHPISYDPYMIGRDTMNQQLASDQEEHPTASMAGGLAGAIGSAIVAPFPKALQASSILGGIAKGAAVGAGYGALSNPGDTEGVYDPLQGGERLSNAGRGAMIGGVTGGVTQAVSKGLKALANSPETLQGAANSQAVKSSGAMLKDYRALNGSNREQAIGQFALDNGLVKAGDTYETVGQKASQLKQDAGKRLDALYKSANAAAKDVEVPEVIGFNPIRDRAQIIDAVRQKLGSAVDKKSAVNAIEGYLDELAEEHGNAVLDPKTANNIESAVSQKVDYMRNPINPSPTNEKAFGVMRKIISDKVDGHIEYLSDIMKDPLAGEKLAEANRDYGYSSTIARMAKDKANRIAANNKMGLTDTIAAGTGAGAGAVVGALSGDSKDAAIGTIAGGIGMGLLHHYGKVYGDAVLSSALNRAGQTMGYGPSQFARLVGSGNPQAANILTRAISQMNSAQGQIAPQPQQAQGYSEGGEVKRPPPPPPPSPIDPQRAKEIEASMRKAFNFAGGGVVPGTAPMPGNSPQNDTVPANLSPGEVVLPRTVTQAPNAPQQAKEFMEKQVTGHTKWAADGLQILKSHVTDEDRQFLEDHKAVLMLDPKSQNLIIAASSFKPGSKPLDDIIKHLKNRLGGK